MTTLTFKALSALLSYPTAALQKAASELIVALDGEALVAGTIRRQLDVLLDELAHHDLYDLQERYVLLFDRTRSLSLHLFEHVHGESRDRGQAMIDLKSMYEGKGLEIAAAELPDFVPLFLEFLSILPRAEAYELLAQPAHIFSALAERLRRRQSAYESVFRALVKLAATKPKGEDISALLQQPDPDADDLAALDAAWEDEPVSFGPGASSCMDGIVAKIRAGRRPVSGAATAAPRPIISHS
ncbi:MAG: nitrate reductase molybdenum cofactor assembly chaperone [Xanthobacteraceae bacterium]